MLISTKPGSLHPARIKEIPEDTNRDKDMNRNSPFILGNKNKTIVEYLARNKNIFRINNFLLFFTGFIGGLQGFALDKKFWCFYLGLTKIFISSLFSCSFA